MKNKKVLAIHLFVWVTAGTVTYSLAHAIIKAIRLPYGVLPSGIPLTISVVMLIAFTVPFYIHYALAPKLTGNKSTFLWRITIVFITLVLPILFIFLDEESITLVNYLATLSYVLLFSFLGACLRIFLLWLDQNQKIATLEKAHLASELSALRAQINPHFLFNTLHNIDALISKSPEAASANLIRLANMMRYVLFTSSHELVSLKNEIEYIEEYIATQQLRLDKGLVNYTFEEDGGSYKIPPMLLIPFIENAFKHFIQNQPCTGIQIAIRVIAGKLHLHCTNDHNPTNLAESISPGFGLENAKKRLELIYNKNYELIITNLNNLFDVKLSLSLQ